MSHATPPLAFSYSFRYKEEYAEAIREIEAVKSEMEAVKQKASGGQILYE